MASVTIGKDDEHMVEALLRSGRYESASDVVREGLRLLGEREQMREVKLEALRRMIAEGDESGPAEDLDIEAIKQEAKRLKHAAKA